MSALVVGKRIKMGRGQKNRITVQCIWCGKFVEIIKSREKVFKYCSHSCWARAMNTGKPKSTEIREKISTTKIMSNHKREKSGNWKGGFTVDALGYVRNNPLGIYEHRRIMEQQLNRKLLNKELIHHVNGNKQDNSIENLEIIDRSTHMKIHKGDINALRKMRHRNG